MMTETIESAKPPAPGALPEAFRKAVELHQEGDLDEADNLYRFCLANEPGSATVWTGFGALLGRRRRYAEAVAAFRKALEIDPGLKDARSELANALCDLGEPEEAIEIQTALLQEDPDDWKQIHNLAIAYRGCWRHQDAVDLIDAAEARLGPCEDLQAQRAKAHLMLGNYAEGFRDSEARFSGGEVALPLNVPWPRWMGESLTGKSIVVLPEQGFGDTIVMSRFLPRLKAMGAHVTMVVEKPLQRLFGQLEGLDQMLAGAGRSQVYDYYTPDMSLPHLVGLPDGLPPPPPRPAIPKDSRERAERITRPFKDRFKVGVIWTGNLINSANHKRSTPPARFLGLATVPGVQLFSLYKGDAHEEFVKSGMCGLIVDACGDDQDFADTAAVIEQMDLMITTDTAVVHIAGSLGKPIWNMLAWEGFWLYGQGDTTSWYPSMRLFRQPAIGDWPGVFADIEAELRAHLGIA